MAGEERASRDEVHFHVLRVIEEATAPTQRESRTRAYDAAQQIDDVDVLQRMVAALATVVALDVVSNPGQRAASMPAHRDRLRRWLEAERLEAMWRADQ